MELHFICDCGMELVANRAAAGKAFRCPSCGLKHILNDDLTRTAVKSPKRASSQAPPSSAPAAPSRRGSGASQIQIPRPSPVPASFLTTSRDPKSLKPKTVLQTTSPTTMIGPAPELPDASVPHLPGGRMADFASPKKSSPAAMIVGPIAAIVGALIGKYAAFNLLIPIVAGAFAGWIAFKATPPSRKPIIPAFAIQSGHFAWMLFGD